MTNPAAQMPQPEHDLKYCVKYLKEATEDTIAKAAELKKTIDVPAVCGFYKELYEVIQLLEAYTTLLKDIKEDYSKDFIPKLMEGMGFDSLKTKGRSFTLVPEFRANIPEEMRENGIKWLRANGYENLVKEGVNSQTLSAAMKEWVKEKGKLPPEDVMKIHRGRYVSMKKA